MKRISFLLFIIASLNANQVPHATIARWIPGSYGNYPKAGHQKPPLPISVIVDFDCHANEEYVKTYCNFLKSANSSLNIHGTPLKHKKIKEGWLIKVKASITQSEVQIELDKANRNFDPEIEKKELQEKLESERKTEEESRKKALEAARLEAEKLQKFKEEQQKIREEKQKKLESIKKNPTEHLHKAILSENREEIELALSAGAQLNESNAYQNPLLKAIYLRKPTATKILLELGANPNIELNPKPCHIAIKNGDLKIASLLIQYGADFSGTIIQNVDAFNYVVSNFDKSSSGSNERDDFELLCAMVKSGYDLQSNFNNQDLTHNAWYQSIVNFKTNHIYFFLDKYPNYRLPFQADPDQIFILPDKSTWNPITLIIKNMPLNNLAESSFKAILSEVKNIDSEFIPIINILNEQKIYAALLNLGIDPTATNIEELKKLIPDSTKKHTALSYALKVGVHGNIIHDLITTGASLSYALELYLQDEGSPEMLIDKKWGLLILAISHNNINAVKILLNTGANCNAIGEWFHYINPIISGAHTPLYYAFQIGNSSIIELLMKAGATQCF